MASRLKTANKAAWARTAVLLLFIGLIAIAAVLHTGIGGYCSSGIFGVSSLCLLGALQAVLAGQSPTPEFWLAAGVLALVLAGETLIRSGSQSPKLALRLGLLLPRGAEALLPQIKDPNFSNLPPVFDIIEHVVATAPGTLQKDLIDLFQALYSVSPTETTYFLREVISTSSNNLTATTFRRISPSLPPRLAEGIRDLVTLIASGGIAQAEHVAKAIICGADLVAVDLPLMIALECRLCGECARGEVCPTHMADFEEAIVNNGKPQIDAREGVKTIAILSAAWESVRSGGKTVKVYDKF